MLIPDSFYFAEDDNSQTFGFVTWAKRFRKVLQSKEISRCWECFLVLLFTEACLLLVLCRQVGGRAEWKVRE